MIHLVTDHPLAADSYDHLHPKGTMQDNTHAPQFVAAVERFRRRVHGVCDLGCAGGGLVKDFLDAGYLAVGVEGSDYSRNAKRAEWATIPDNLFTADITRPFHFQTEKGNAIRFDLVTAWEVLEHIAEDDLGGLMANLRRNLTDDGLFVASIAQFEDEGYHVTLQSTKWWIALFEREGFEIVNGAFLEKDMARKSSLYLTVQKVVV